MHSLCLPPSPPKKFSPLTRLMTVISSKAWHPLHQELPDRTPVSQGMLLLYTMNERIWLKGSTNMRADVRRRAKPAIISRILTGGDSSACPAPSVLIQQLATFLCRDHFLGSGPPFLTMNWFCERRLACHQQLGLFSAKVSMQKWGLSACKSLQSKHLNFHSSPH